MMIKRFARLTALATLLSIHSVSAATQTVQATDVSVSGQLKDNRAELTIAATLLDPDPQDPALVYTTQISDHYQLTDDEVRQTTQFEFHRLQGSMKKLRLGYNGDQKPDTIQGEHLASWSIRYENPERPEIELIFSEDAWRRDDYRIQVTFKTELPELPFDQSPIIWRLAHPQLSAGRLTISHAESLKISPRNLHNLSQLNLTPRDIPAAAEPLVYRFQGTDYGLDLNVAPQDPDALRIRLDSLELNGTYNESALSFTVKGTARTENRHGARLAILSGAAAITDFSLPQGVSLELIEGTYQLHLEQPGSFPVRFEFQAKIIREGAWRRTDFHLPSAPMFPLKLSGFGSDLELQIAGGGPIDKENVEQLRGFVPSNGHLQLRWRPEEELLSSRLFYNTTSRSQIRIGTGVLRQITEIDLRVMQGELTELNVEVAGLGEITRVTAPGLLSWGLESGENNQRTLIIRFNQAQTNQATIGITAVATVGEFPTQVTPLRLSPTDSDRHHGSLEVVNEGAVRLSVVSSEGLSRITPEAITPSSQAKAAASVPQQVFAFRHSGPDYELTVQASMIQPDITASAILLYHLDYDQTRIDADFELEIRDAPIREFVFLVPTDYNLTDLTTAHMADFFSSATADDTTSQLRIVFNRPIIDRHQIRLRLEKNTPQTEPTWLLGQIQPQGVRQVRGHLGVSSIEGFRIEPDTVTGMTEIASVYFPRKLSGLQTAFRLTDADWSLNLSTTQIPQAIQVDSFHMYTLGNGIINGSSLLHFEISGAPLDTFSFTIPTEYRNVEFTGDNIRNWSATDGQYTVLLQSPIIGAYSLLVTFERSFTDTGDTLTATGVIPLATDSDQGTIVITSNRQVQLEEPETLNELIRLTPEELASDERLLVQQPVLAAYQYNQRPINLELGITTFAEAATARQIVDRADIETRVARDGQTVSTIRYLVKTSGTPHLNLSLPANTELWTAKVDNQTVVSINTDSGTLIPIPPDGADLRLIELKLAAANSQASPVRVDLPVLDVPILHSSWRLEAAPLRRLQFLEGTMLPSTSRSNSNGFHQLQGIFTGSRPWTRDSGPFLLGSLLLLMIGIGLCHFARSPQILPFKIRRILTVTLGCLAIMAALGIGVAVNLDSLDRIPSPEHNIAAHSSIISSGEVIFLSVENRPFEILAQDVVRLGWPLVIALALAIYGRTHQAGNTRYISVTVAWCFALLAILAWPLGGPLALILILLLLTSQLAWPAFQKLRHAAHTIATTESLSKVTAILSGLLLMSSSQVEAAPHNASIADVVEQQILIQEDHAFGHVTLRWQATANDSINLLKEPGILSHIEYDQTKLSLTDNQSSPVTKRLIASEDGLFEIQFDYQIPISNEQTPRVFELPTYYGLINRAQVTLDEENAELVISNAIEITPADGPNPAASYWEVVLPPQNEVQISWAPKSRDRSEETAVYFAEWTHLLTPSSGLVETYHDLAIRPAQGEIKRLTVALPDHLTVNDIIANDLENWRFDPDTHLVRIDLGAAQSKAFLVRILSQSVTEPLPFATSQQFPRLIGANGEVGSVGLAAQKDIQLSNLTTEQLVAIDPQDFRSVLLELSRQQFPQSTLRQAFRYTSPGASLAFQADEVEPHITVVSDDRLSLGEDRVLLASKLNLTIARAGVFSLSFALPAGLSVDTVTGEQLSHWTELEEETGRQITLHLKNRWEGPLQFNLTLSGPGIGTTPDWQAPRLVINEANRQRGQLVLIPEQGIRLRATTQENTSQADSRARGLAQSGALAYDLLSADWNLVFQIEAVAPGIEARSLQDVLFSEGKVSVSTYLDFQIKNTAIKELSLQLPAEAVNVRFDGRHLGDTVLDESGAQQNWTVRLDQRVIGSYRLTVRYQLRLQENGSTTNVTGLKTVATSSHRGYLTLRSEGRLQISVPQPPTTLYETDATNIPRDLRQFLPPNLPLAQSYRVVDTDFSLPVNYARLQLTPTLSAEVKRIQLNTVVSTTGAALTEAEIRLIPGSKRSLAVQLPPGSVFWFAKINQQGVPTWTRDEQLVIPLTQSLSESTETLLQVYYQTPSPAPTNDRLDASLTSLVLDVPANQVFWNVFVDERWNVNDWNSNMQLVTQSRNIKSNTKNLETFFEQELTRRAGRTREAENWLAQGNEFLNAGNDTLARNAFRNAYGLTQHDAAFNEDARVQLWTVKTQQAMAGISEQQRKSSATANQQSSSPSEDSQSSQQILAAADPAKENTLLNLANRLISQHEDTSAMRQGFDIVLPKEGSQFEFVKNVQVNTGTALTIQLSGAPQNKRSPWWISLLILLVVPLITLRHRTQPAREQAN